MGNSHGMREFAGSDLEVRRAVPIATLHHVARRCSGLRKCGCEGVCIGPQGLDFGDDTERLLVLTKLQIGVDQIILTVHLIAQFLAGLRSLNGCKVGGD